MRPSPYSPEVDDIADQIDDVRLEVLQEIEKLLPVRGSGPQMHVGNEQCPHMAAEACTCLDLVPGFGHVASRTDSRHRRVTAAADEWPARQLRASGEGESRLPG